jgi:predicted TIM-barrel fold metal-dependent hydrolase
LVYGFVYINPANENKMDVLRKGIEDRGMAGVKLWVATFCNDPSAYPIVEKCIEYNVPILIHTWKKAIGQYAHEATAEHVADLAKHYPQAKLIAAHLGGNAYHGVHAIRDYPNVMTDISCSVFRGDDLDYAVEQLGAERILFGSDMPGSYLVNVGQVEEAKLTKEKKDLIYYKNAQRMLDRNCRI